MTRILVLIIFLFLVSIFGGNNFSSAEESITAQQAIEKATAYIQSGNSYDFVDSTQNATLLLIDCSKAIYPRSCKEILDQEASSDGLTFWILKFPIKKDTPSFMLKNVTDFWVAIDAFTGEVETPEQDDFKYLARYLIDGMWQDFEDKKYDSALNKGYYIYFHLHEKGRILNASLVEFPWQSNDKIFEYWPVNYMGESLFIVGEILFKQENYCKSQEIFQLLTKDYQFSQILSP